MTRVTMYRRYVNTCRCFPRITIPTKEESSIKNFAYQISEEILEGVRVFRYRGERCVVFVMLFVYVLVEEWIVHYTVSQVEKYVFTVQKEQNLKRILMSDLDFNYKVGKSSKRYDDLLTDKYIPIGKYTKCARNRCFKVLYFNSAQFVLFQCQGLLS
jgi:hypothetical protein